MLCRPIGLPEALQNTIQQPEFVQLVNEHQPLIHKVCNLYGHSMPDREDLFQEIVIQLWKAYPKFRGESKFSTWLYRIALNTAISGLRKQRNHITSLEPERLPVDIQEEAYNTQKEEQLQQMYSAIRQLSELERALVMLYLEDRSYDEMEDILGINQNNLRVKMNRVKEKLRKLTNQ
ncbi:MAG TPA: sigma-70 family RNA polymerase sigma factor [Chitinophagaceae bacterium]|nr:sigma-70 family RNA polymerase sigma factor [Chitinophagaceae bacterium]